MAYSPSPHIPNLAVAGTSSRFNRHSPSPTLPQPLSKRDKKRNVMENRLAEISSSFAENRDHIYRKQLQALQADMNYIQAARLYDNVPLDQIGDEGPEEASTSAAASAAGSFRNAHQAHLPNHMRLETTHRTGPRTAEFIQEVNDAMEQRDADLTTIVVCKNSHFLPGSTCILITACFSSAQINSNMSIVPPQLSYPRSPERQHL